jgi:hypothetical protein
MLMAVRPWLAEELETAGKTKIRNLAFTFHLFGALKNVRSNSSSSLRPPTMNRDLPKIALFRCLVERGAV